MHIDSTIRGLPKLEIPASPGSGGKDSGQSLNLEPDTPIDLDRSNDSPKSGDAFSISNVLGHETQRSIRPPKHIDSMQGGHQKQSGKTPLLSKQSNGNIRTESFNHGNKQPNPVQPSSTLLNNGANPTSGGTSTKRCKPSLHSHAENQKRTFVGMDKQVKNTPVISSHMLQKAAVEHGTAIRHEKNCLTSLSRAQVDILVDTVLRNHPKEVHQYRSSEKKELIVFYLAGVYITMSFIFKMIDVCFNFYNVTIKRNVQQEETRNGGNVGP
ncbi:hypothetical protein Cgig2_003021 [Carnegiea gigantea]|uniref:Uncharacterized protein n=1 Tax=Carnegiea gigantea TaxID=171969 RepID=A0A9Q1GQ12_9CARY|nr:hypothetical protein Cgig2_003021 [Carnegiea gigantea]